MSRAGARALRARRDGDRALLWMRRVEANRAVDAVLVRCDGCGLVQVSPGPPCVLCGCWTGTYVGRPV